MDCPPVQTPEQLCVAREVEEIEAFINGVLESHVGSTFEPDRRLGQRGLADIVEATVRDWLVEAGRRQDTLDVSPARTKKSMEDVGFRHGPALVYLDVKTKDAKAARFSMPNLVSIDRLSEFYKSGRNVFSIAHVEYVAYGDDEVVISKAELRRIEQVSWDCLLLGNIGKGQLQLNSKKGLLEFSGTRTEWIDRLHDEGIRFYGKQALKCIEREELWKRRRRTPSRGS